MLVDLDKPLRLNRNVSNADFSRKETLLNTGPVAEMLFCAVFAMQLNFNHFFSFEDGAGTNKQHIATKNTAKLDRETEELRHGKISLDVGKLIQQGRQGKGLSQKDLATVSTLIPLFIHSCSHQRNHKGVLRLWVIVISRLLAFCQGRL